MKNIKLSNPEYERKLVVSLIAGEETAFCKLYALYKNRLIYFAQKYVKSKEVAEDLFHDTFAAIWHNRLYINSDANFSAYLYTIMRNRIFNLLSHMDKESSIKDIILSNAIDATNETDNTVNYNELESIINLASSKLTPQQLRVFELSRKKMLSNKEIAKELGISVNTVQQHLSDALHTLRASISNYSDIAVTSAILLISSGFC